MSINDFKLLHSEKLESLRTCIDFSDFARERIYERIPPKASSLEKTACIAKLSAESLKWLIDDTHARYNRLNREARGEHLSPFVFQSWSLYNHYWLFEVVKASILAGSYPLESKGFNSLAPDRKSNPEFNEHWPQTPGATAFWGAGMSTAEAILEALFIFLKKSFLWHFPSLPNYRALDILCEPYDKESLERKFNETGDLLPLIPAWQNLSLYHAVEYIPPDKWPPANLDKEYSRVISLIDHEATQAHKKPPVATETKQADTADLTDTERNGGKAGKTKTIAKRFSFNEAQAFFDGKDLQLPTGAELVPVKILKKLHKSFGTIVPFKTLDENSTDTASDFLRGKIRTILLAFKKHKVPCKIQSKKWTGYILSNSKTHS
jgi:hypothetical protein